MSLSANTTDRHNQLLVDLCGDLNRINNRRRRRQRSSWQTVSTNTNEGSAEPTPMATNSKGPSQDEELSVPPPSYHSHDFANRDWLNLDISEKYNTKISTNNFEFLSNIRSPKFIQFALPN